jgi:hypothetical protein
VTKSARPWIPLLILGGLSPTLLSAADGAPTAAAAAPAATVEAAPAPSGIPNGEAGMVVVRNTDGTLRAPTASELAALGLLSPLNHSDEGLVQVVHPNGTVSIDLQDRYQELSMARVAADGSRQMLCNGAPQTVAAFLFAAWSSPKPLAAEVNNER